MKTIKSILLTPSLFTFHFSLFTFLLLPLLASAASFEKVTLLRMDHNWGYNAYRCVEDNAVGNYRVDLTLGPWTIPTTNFVFSEATRLTCASVVLPANTTTNLSFCTRVTGKRTKNRGDHYHEVHVCMEVVTQGDTPPADPTITRDDAVKTVFIAGDSTVCDAPSVPFVSWGRCFPCFMQNVATPNHARSGLTLASFKSQGRLQTALDAMKTGDFMLVQFGHNDQKGGDYDKRKAEYYSQVTNYYNAITAKGGTMVLLSPCERYRFSRGVAGHSLSEYQVWAEDAAKGLGIPFIPLNDLSVDLYNAYGEQEAKNLFCKYAANYFPNTSAFNDSTHHGLLGAYMLARIVAAKLYELDTGLKDNVRPEYRTFDPTVKPEDPLIPYVGFVNGSKPEGS